VIRTSWIALRLIAVAGLVAVWHVLILTRLQDAPGLVAALLLALFAVVAAGRTVARRLPEANRGPAARAVAGLDAPALAAVAAGFVLVFLFHWGFERAASDGREYYVQVRSLVIDHDLDFANEAVFGTRGTAGWYAFGAAVLWAPFFLVAHLWLALLNLFGAEFVRDGYGLPYQRAVGVGTLAYGIAGLGLIFAILQDYFSRWMSWLGLVVVCFGSFVVWYLVVENSMVHGVSMFATTLFLYLWHRSRRRERPADWIAIGAAAGLMAMVRWQNVLFAVVPFAELVLRTRMAAPRVSAAGLLRRLALAGAAAFVTFAPQLIFWKAVDGRWWALPSGEHGVEWTSLWIVDVLFSSNHGLLSSTPIVALSLPGLLLLVRRDPWLTAVLAAGLFGQLYINSSVDIWWGGAGFGARRFTNCALVFAVGMTSGLEWCRRRPLVAPVAVAGSFLLLNAVVMADLRAGRWSSGDAIAYDDMTDAFYDAVGNPFSWPVGAAVAWTYDVGMPFYDQLRGRTFNNVTVDIGADDDVRFLGHGWSERERSSEMSFRWANAPEAVVVVPLKESDDYRLDIRAVPFDHPGEQQTLQVIVNGIALDTVGMRGYVDSYAMDIPASAIRPNLNQFRFRFGYAVSPAVLGLSNDSRTLAVLFDEIRLTRLLND